MLQIIARNQLGELAKETQQMQDLEAKVKASLDLKPAVYERYSLLIKAISFLLISAAGFYYFEQEAWPDLTYSDSLWWSLVTAMTVGYGDIYPKTWQGKWLVAAPTIILGIGLLAYTFGIVEKGSGIDYAWRKLTN
jgi:hypothetical protein